VGERDALDAALKETGRNTASDKVVAKRSIPEL
jgi:hypothetical protein